MKRTVSKTQAWLLSKSKKEMQRRRKRNKRKRIKTKNFNTTSSNQNSDILNNKKVYYSRVKAPSILSLINNSMETLSYFKTVKNTIDKTKIRGNVFFDLSDVTNVTVDAIMYLIATIVNMKRIKALQISCSGNVPKNLRAREIFETSGFYKYVSAQQRLKYYPNSDNIKITRGIQANPVLIGEICSFVHEHSNLNRIDTRVLYSIILELMTNTKQHAYNDNALMEKNWYVFLEDSNEFLTFVFLDTGAGIPNTIKIRGISEKIKSVLNNNDAFFISSAFKGDVLRSETDLSYRGRGLPEIYNKIKNIYIEDFSVISGYGRCDFTKDGEIFELNYNSDLIGTMYYWKLKKEV